MRHVLAAAAVGGAIAAVPLLSEERALAADPTTGDCLAASDASLRSGNQHKLRAERSQLLVCAAPSCPADIRKECVRRVDEVNTQIPTIIFEAKTGAGNDLSAVKVTVDGDVLAERLEGIALSIDPGEHVFTFETAGQPPVTKRFVIREAQKDRREEVTFGTPETRPTATVPQEHPVMQPPAGTTNESPGGLGTQQTVALVAGGVGVVGLGLGTVFGVMAISKRNDAQSACPGPDHCTTQDGVSKWSEAGSTGNVSTIGFIVGGVAVAGAAALWLTAPSSGSRATQVGFGPGSIQLKGTW